MKGISQHGGEIHAKEHRDQQKVEVTILLLGPKFHHATRALRGQTEYLAIELIPLIHGMI